ncbi:MAG: ribosome silencing factor [Pyrinomonadaceae bacterium]
MEEVSKSKSLERGDVREEIELTVKTTPFETLDDNLKLAFECADEKKAVDSVILDLRDVTSFTEFFLITSGTNQRQVQAIADEITSKVRKAFKQRPIRVEGYAAAEWVLLDYGDFIVHIFNEKSREFYDLERLWRDAAKVELA